MARMDHAQTIVAGFAGVDLAPRRALPRRRFGSRYSLLPLLLASLTPLAVPHYLEAQGNPAGFFAAFNKKLGEKRTNVTTWLRAGEIPPDAAAKKDFDDYFNNYALMLAIMPVPGKELSNQRKLLKQTYFSSPGPGNKAREHLNELTLDFMKKAARAPDLPLEIKYGAMLVLTELNEYEAKPPKALPATLPLFMQLFKLPKVTDAYRVVALIGIKNHAESNSAYPMDPPVKADLEAALLDLILAEPPNGRSVDGHNWLRRMAIEIMGILGDVELKEKKINIARVLERIVTSDDEPLAVRCAAAQALGSLKDLQTAVEFKTVPQDIGYLLVDACTQELASAKQKEEIPSRRRLDYLAQMVRDGFAGPGGVNPNKLPRLLITATKKGDREYVEAVNKKISELIKIVETTSDSGLAAAIEEWLPKFKDVLEPKPALAPAEKSGGATPGGKPEGDRAEVRRTFPAAN